MKYGFLLVECLTLCCILACSHAASAQTHPRSQPSVTIFYTSFDWISEEAETRRHIEKRAEFVLEVATTSKWATELREVLRNAPVQDEKSEHFDDESVHAKILGIDGEVFFVDVHGAIQKCDGTKYQLSDLALETLKSLLERLSWDAKAVKRIADVRRLERQHGLRTPPKELKGPSTKEHGSAPGHSAGN